MATSNIDSSGSSEAPLKTISTLLTYGRQCLDEDDKKAVAEVLDGDWLTQGPVTERFERALSERFGARHALTCSNGTAALHLAALALGWGPGDVILVPAVTFLASANCCAYVGAQPYFVDIDDRTLTLEPDAAERAIKALGAAGRRVRGIVAVDMAGQPCDWPGLKALADRYSLDLVDDACHALGATYAGGVKIGSGEHATITTLSFHPVKHITTGEGGAVLTNDARRAERVARLRSHGTVRGRDNIDNWDGPWQYDMVDLGYNYRLSDIQSALGLSQLAKLDRFVRRRRQIAAEYHAAFASQPLVRRPEERPDSEHAYHLYIARIDFGAAGISKAELFERCRERQLALQVHYRPVFMNSYYRGHADNRDAAARMPVSARYYAETVSLPMYPQLTSEDVARVVETLATCLAR